METGGDAFRLHRTQEVAGSSPASSTPERPANAGLSFSPARTRSGEIGAWSSLGQKRVTLPDKSGRSRFYAGLLDGCDTTCLTACGRLAALRGQLHFAQADTPGRHLDALVLTDELERLVERLRAR